MTPSATSARAASPLPCSIRPVSRPVSVGASRTPGAATDRSSPCSPGATCAKRSGSTSCPRTPSASTTRWPRTRWRRPGSTPLRRQTTYRAAEIGLIRGLFWQPHHVELLPTAAGGRCEACQGDSPRLVPAFNKAPFAFGVMGCWLHPHSTQQGDLHQARRSGCATASSTPARPPGIS